jgi:hypothetical protein
MGTWSYHKRLVFAKANRTLNAPKDWIIGRLIHMHPVRVPTIKIFWEIAKSVIRSDQIVGRPKILKDLLHIGTSPSPPRKSSMSGFMELEDTMGRNR